VPALFIHDFVSVSNIGAATGGGPYKRMKQSWPTSAVEKAMKYGADMSYF
jgi:hypothetical protein